MLGCGTASPFEPEFAALLFLVLPDKRRGPARGGAVNGVGMRVGSDRCNFLSAAC